MGGFNIQQAQGNGPVQQNNQINAQGALNAQLTNALQNCSQPQQQYAVIGQYVLMAPQCSSVYNGQTGDIKETYLTDKAFQMLAGKLGQMFGSQSTRFMVNSQSSINVTIANLNGKIKKDTVEYAMANNNKERALAVMNAPGVNTAELLKILGECIDSMGELEKMFRGFS